MQKRAYTFQEFDFGSKIIHDLIQNKDSVAPFIADFFDLAEMEKMIEKRKTFSPDRKKTQAAIETQNKDLKLSDRTKKNIELLTETNSFTITTGHQLNLLTGPLYSIYKIVQTIVLTNELAKRYPAYHFIPVFWMATEDHDFEEINHLHLFGRKLTWEKKEQADVVAGRISTQSIDPLYHELKSLFQDELMQEKLGVLLGCYQSSETLAEATRKLIHHFFDAYGLVILDGDDANLKSEMIPVFKREVQEQITWNEVSKTNQALEKAGYHQQVYVRECNLFYIHENGKRERIVFENNHFHYGDARYSGTDLIAQIEKNPSYFSPNALLRPVYQELILPNLVYVGGGGEIAYWLQLKNLFEALNISYPLLRVRDSLILIQEKQLEDLEKSGLNLRDLQEDPNQLMNRLTVEKHGELLSLAEAETEILNIKNQIIAKTQAVDANLTGFVEAEFSKINASLEKMESKLIKSAKAKDDILKNRILKLREKLFPENHFQERYENILAYYLKDDTILKKITETITAENEPRVRVLTL